jgi:hypothetical protein
MISPQNNSKIKIKKFEVTLERPNIGNLMRQVEATDRWLSELAYSPLKQSLIITP